MLQRRKLARVAAHLNAASGAPLPPLILVTDDERLTNPIAAARALPLGSMVIVRSRDGARRIELFRALRAVTDLIVLIAGDLELARMADGLHLPEARAHEASYWRSRHPSLLITAASHGRVIAHVDAVLLSPVFPTLSHPGMHPLSAVRANAFAARSKSPVYALGGVTARNAGLLRGFAGIAAIGALAV